MRFQHLARGTAALVLSCVPFSGAHAQSGDKPGSAYVQCDGQPNNMSDGETAARVLGAVTLIGLFAPPPESADASKRKFGSAGVAACTSLLEGERREGNPQRRLGLLLGRAIHHIEAKNYEAAVADAQLARREAQAAGLSADPYFARSRGLAFDRVESAALLRMGKLDEARAASLRTADKLQYSLLGLFTTPTYDQLIATPSADEDRVQHWRSRLAPALASLRADRLDLAGRFADSARVRDAYVEFDAEHSPELNSSIALAQAAVAHALAGNSATAAERMAAARANADKRKAAGKPESDAAELVELFDLYTIIDTARSGDAKIARRLFSARSEWVGASLGSVLEVNRRLRDGAAPDELIGGLAKDSEQLWKERSETKLTELFAKDSDNKTLFHLVPSLDSARAYHALSKNVWRTDKSRLIIKTKADTAKTRMEFMFLPMVDPAVAMDAYVLHAALVARSRGHEGFVFSPIISEKIFAAGFRSGNRGQKGFSDDVFIPAADVIAQLSPIIPDPETLKAKARR